MAATRYVVFMGSKEGGLALARLLFDLGGAVRPALVLCPDDRADARSCLGEFERLCARQGVTLRCTHEVTEVQAALAAVGPALVLVHGWYRLIPIDELPACEFYGFHYSVLPAYRGNAPLVWQIINGEPRTGISFFRLGAGLDDGDLVGQGSFDLGPDESIADALARANTLALELARSSLPALVEGCQPLRPQSAEGGSYCSLRLPEDGLVDWEWPARRVHDFVRAQTRPYPGAFSVLGDGRILRIWRCAVDARRMFGPPGAVIGVEGDTVVVACGDASALRVLACSIDDEPDIAPARAVGSLRVRLGRRLQANRS